MKIITLKLLLPILFCILSLDVIAQTAVVYQSTQIDGSTRTLDKSTCVPGSLPGSVDVSPTGAANYQLPIQVSPGSNGVVPNLSIVYNSQSGNDILGWGFHLAGLSSITRVNKTTYFDGRDEAFTLADSDAFELDGERLIPITSTTYYLEHDPYTKVTYSATTKSFTVNTPNGGTIEYGNTADSKFLPVAGTTPISYQINRSIDANGNYIQYIYNGDAQSGEHNISEIKYTGNQPNGIAPYNSVKFIYGTRSDANSAYTPTGLLVKQTQLLTSIQVFAEGTLSKQYNFAYFLGTDGISKLNTVSFIGDGIKYNPTVLNWENQGVSLSSTAAEVSTAIPITGDFDGNGMNDIAYENSRNSFSIKLRNANDSSTTFTFTEKDIVLKMADGKIADGEWFIISDIVSEDINNDGKDELFVTYSKYQSELNGGIYYNWTSIQTFRYSYNSSRSQFEELLVAEKQSTNIKSRTLPYSPSTNESSRTIAKESFSIVFIDLQNCGQNDIVYCYNNSITSLNTNYRLPFDSGVSISQSDFDGDNNKEILVLNLDGSLSAWEYDGVIFRNIIGLTAPKGFVNSPADFMLTDFNGDGKTDIFNLSTNTENAGIWISKCNSFQKTDFAAWVGQELPSSNRETSISTSSTIKVCYMFFDLNGDGHADLVKAKGDSLSLYVWRNSNLSLAATIDVSNLSANSFNHVKLGLIDNNRDGQVEIFYKNNAEGCKMISLGSLLVKNRFVKKIVNGINYISTIQPLYYNDVRTYDTTIMNPDKMVTLLRNGFWVVSNVTEFSSGINLSNTSYTYSNGYLHYTKGFLGFKQTTTFNLINGITIQNNYSHQLTGTDYYPWLQSQTVTRNGIPISSSTNTMVAKKISLNGKSFIPFVTTTSEIDKLKGITATTNSTFDETIGKVTSQTTNIGSWTTTQSRSFEKAGSGDYSYRPTLETTTKSNGTGTFSEKINYTYVGGSTPFRVSSVKYQDNLTKTFNTFDAWGNVTKITTSAPLATTTTDTYSYDSKGRFALSTTNSKGYISSKTYRACDGALLTETDINGLKTTYTQSVTGSSIVQTVSSPDGNGVTSTTNWDQTYLYYIQNTDKLTKTNSYTYFNNLGKKVKEVSSGYKGTISTTVYSYNPDGGLASTTTSGVSKATINSYYPDGRLSTTTSNNSSVTYSYDKLKVTTKTVSGKTATTSTSTYDEVGLLKQTVSDNGTVLYSYYPSGKIKEITAGGAVTNMSYDNMGNQLTLESPDAGKMSYTYSGFGQLLTQTDAKGQTTTCSYDILGRLTSKIGTDAAKNALLNVIYTYYETSGALGLLNSVTRDGVSETYTYDTYGRLLKTSTKGGGKEFISSCTYNSLGEVATATAPTGLTVEYVYDLARNITQINNAADHSKIWSGDSQNSRNQWSSFSMGNGLVTTYGYNATNFTLATIKTGTATNTTSVQNLTYDYDNEGTLLKRGESIAPSTTLTEEFTYDAQNRLKSSKLGSGDMQTFFFATNGNIDSTSLAGKYKYEAVGFPHAVTAVNGLAASGTASKVGSNGTYSIENKVLTFENGTLLSNGTIQSENKALFTYGVDGNRFKMDWYKTGALKCSKYYIGNSEYGYDALGKTIYSRTFITAPTGICAVYQDSASVKSFSYIHTDNQGSWLAITNQQGSLTSRSSYDAWGRARDPLTWKLKPISITNVLANLSAMQPRFDRGYTGHEQLAGFGLINMNGRMYDPYLQRFLSPDNVVQAADNVQNYNRYSYCLNNPLKYTDPSGWTYYKYYQSPATGISGCYYASGDMDGFHSGGGGYGFAGGSGEGGDGFRGGGGYGGGGGSMGYTPLGNGQYVDNSTAEVVEFGEMYSHLDNRGSAIAIAQAGLGGIVNMGRNASGQYGSWTTSVTSAFSASGDRWMSSTATSTFKAYGGGNDSYKNSFAYYVFGELASGKYGSNEYNPYLPDGVGMELSGSVTIPLTRHSYSFSGGLFMTRSQIKPYASIAYSVGYGNPGFGLSVNAYMSTYIGLGRVNVNNISGPSDGAGLNLGYWGLSGSHADGGFDNYGLTFNIVPSISIGATHSKTF